MSVSTLSAPSSLLERAVDQVPKFFDTDLIVTPPDNPVYTPAQVADLVESMRPHGQLVPAWVCPSPDLPPEQRLCLEGNRRLTAARMLGMRLWAFDLGRFAPEEERIRLTFQHNSTRRVMSREEMAQRAARYIELTGCSASEAATLLNVSGPTLSRAFGERKIPAGLKPRADRLGLSIRSLIASAPPTAMERALAYAETPGADGKKPTRDMVADHIRHLKKSGNAPARRKTITLRLSGREMTFAVSEKDTAFTVAEYLKAVIAKLTKHSEVPPDGWPFLFQ